MSEIARGKGNGLHALPDYKLYLSFRGVINEFNFFFFGPNARLWNVGNTFMKSGVGIGWRRLGGYTVWTA